MALHDHILLATDLSARSDRALDRALLLARRDGAKLVVLHVIEPIPGNRYFPVTHSLSHLASLAIAQLLHDLGDLADRVQIRIEEGDPADVIERVARELRSTLIVVGVARVERLGRFSLGATVERLVRDAEAPLLIVTDRPRGSYRRVGVPVDFSATARDVLELATSLFPDQPITAFHAYQPIAGYGVSERYREQARDQAASELETWLDQSRISSETRALVHQRVELGDPARAVRDAAANGGFDLVVIGSRGRGRIFELVIGSVGKQILAELPCDALFVREQRAPELRR